MSIDKANSYIKSHIEKFAPEISKALYNDYRSLLDSKVTILDLSKAALKVNLKKESSSALEDYDNIYTKLVSVVRSNVYASRTFSSLEEAAISLGDNLLKAPVLIDNGDNNRFIIGSSFGSIRNFVTRYISNDPKLIASRFGAKDGKSLLDIGHIASEDNENLTSPLEQKLLAVAEVSNDPTIALRVKESLNKLYKIQADFTYNFKNTAPEAVSSAQTVLGTTYIVTTLHSNVKNKEFSVSETAIYRKLVLDIAKSLNIQNIPGSNTIIEDVHEGIASTIKLGAPVIKRHAKASGKTSVKGTKKAKTPSAFNVILKTIKNRNYSLSSLQNLINESLVHVIASHMGDGNERRVLNYRTGRFAQSAKVERLSVDRAGAISAFYSYMKHPYATFSEGGAQQFPKTRDPKLIISQSIREIATTKVANRMRAILI